MGGRKYFRESLSSQSMLCRPYIQKLHFFGIILLENVRQQVGGFLVISPSISSIFHPHIRSEKAEAEAVLKRSKTISRTAAAVNKKQGILYSLTTCLYMLD